MSSICLQPQIFLGSGWPGWWRTYMDNSRDLWWWENVPCWFLFDSICVSCTDEAGRKERNVLYAPFYKNSFPTYTKKRKTKKEMKNSPPKRVGDDEECCRTPYMTGPRQSFVSSVRISACCHIGKCLQHQRNSLNVFREEKVSFTTGSISSVSRGHLKEGTEDWTEQQLLLLTYKKELKQTTHWLFLFNCKMIAKCLS